jgi:hypothetical protein
VHVLANRCRFEVIHTADPVAALRLAADGLYQMIYVAVTCGRGY